MADSAGLLDKWPKSEDGSEDEDIELQHTQRSHHRRWLLTCSCMAFASLFGVLVLLGYLTGAHLSFQHQGSDTSDVPQIPQGSKCKDLAFRREWRSLSEIEKHHYLDAVQCLSQKSSQLGLNSSRYHDLSWVHYHQGRGCE